jgi:beta-glucosidase-like glycosyl hydrolase
MWAVQRFSVGDSHTFILTTCTLTNTPISLPSHSRCRACAHVLDALISHALQGLITEADIDHHLLNLFHVRVRLGHFDPPGALQQITYNTTVCTASAKELARDGARQGVVMLKNNISPNYDSTILQRNTLPLNAGALGNIAVIGPNANLSQQMAEYYGGNTCIYRPSLVDVPQP